MSTYHPFRDDCDHLPPGRTRLTWVEAETLLVHSSLFTGSSTRQDLWTGLTRYLCRFFDLQARYDSVFDGAPLVHFLWLGGSFASKKLDPRQIDVSIALDAGARRALAGRVGAGWLSDAFCRSRCEEKFGVSALEVPYVAVPSPFRSDQLGIDAQNYLRERGAWDDWWQRTRLPGMADCAPSVDTAKTVRGYLEVVLT